MATTRKPLTDGNPGHLTAVAVADPRHEWPYWMVVVEDGELGWLAMFHDDNHQAFTKDTALKEAERLATDYPEVRCMEARMRSCWGPRDTSVRPEPSDKD